ncbi:hypothetical protein [Paracoccus versutus]
MSPIPTDHDKARETVEHLRAYDARTATGRLIHRAADLITAQAEEIQRLRDAIRQADDILEDRGLPCPRRPAMTDLSTDDLKSLLAEATPGPWEIVSLSGYGSPFSIRMAYRPHDPSTPATHYGVQSVRRREDARLIAHAPDLAAEMIRLREALRGMVALYDSDDGTRNLPEVVAARAALTSGEDG